MKGGGGGGVDYGTSHGVYLYGFVLNGFMLLAHAGKNEYGEGQILQLTALVPIHSPLDIIILKQLIVTSCAEYYIRLIINSKCTKTLIP